MHCYSSTKSTAEVVIEFFRATHVLVSFSHCTPWSLPNSVTQLPSWRLTIWGFLLNSVHPWANPARLRCSPRLIRFKDSPEFASSIKSQYHSNTKCHEVNLLFVITSVLQLPAYMWIYIKRYFVPMIRTRTIWKILREFHKNVGFHP